MIEGISDELHELSNDYNPNEAQLADKIIEITGIWEIYKWNSEMLSQWA